MGTNQKECKVIPVNTFPTNGYLLAGEKIVAVDVGAPSVAEKMAELVTEQLGRPLSDLAAVTATHFHVDHVGGVKRLLELAPTARVLLSAHIRPHVEEGRPLVFPRPRRWINMFTHRLAVRISRPSPADLVGMSRIGLPLGLNEALPFEVDGYLSEGDRLPGSDFVVVETPGHSSDSISFYRQAGGDLLCGDLILGGELGPFINSFIVDREQILASVEKLSRLGIINIFPGHGRIFSGAGIMDGLEQSLAPDGLVSIPFFLRRRLEKRFAGR